MKLELGNMLDTADTFLFTAHWVAKDEHGADAEIVLRIERLRADLAEAKQVLAPVEVYA